MYIKQLSLTNHFIPLLYSYVYILTTNISNSTNFLFNSPAHISRERHTRYCQFPSDKRAISRDSPHKKEKKEKEIGKRVGVP